jgi:tight adherence protein C
MPMLLFLAAVCLSSSVFAVAQLATAPARARRARLTAATRYGVVRAPAAPLRPPFRERVLAPLVDAVARAMLRLNPRTSVESVSALLASAGMLETSPYAFLAAKGVGGCVGAVAGFGIGAATSPGVSLLFAAAFGALGYVLPSVLVGGRAARRRERLVVDLPDALDLLAVSVEAGLGFDAAVAKLTEHMEGPLSREFELALGQMRVGDSRADALRKLAERAGAPEVGAFVRAIVQADQLGTSLGRILRVQAVDTRVKRQAAAEERAMKAPVKMLFPTVLFIFPAMFIVVLGPAMLSLGKLFGF